MGEEVSFPWGHEIQEAATNPDEGVKQLFKRVCEDIALLREFMSRHAVMTLRGLFQFWGG